MTLESEHSFSLQCVPNIAVEVVITSKQETSTDGESDGGNSAQNIVVSVLHQLSIRSNIKKPARSIVRSSSEGETVGKKLYCVNIGLMSLEGLCALSSTKIPQPCGRIASSGNESVLIGRIDGNAHNISIVVAKFSNLRAGLNVP